MKSKQIRQRMMMLKAGSPAIHKLGDIGGSEEDELIDVYRETEDLYIGSFVLGYGFIHVIFKKSDVRPLTEKELNDISPKQYAINDTVYGGLKLDKDGYYDYDWNTEDREDFGDEEYGDE